MKQALCSLVLLLVLVAAWYGLFRVVGDTGLASPTATLARLVDLLGSAPFWGHVGATGYAFGWALVFSMIGGIVLGLALGMNRTAGLVSEPILVNLYSLPKVTLYPIVLLIFGLGAPAKVAFGVMHGLIPLCLFTMNAIIQVKPVYLRTAGVMRLSALETARTVILPAILPDLLTGMRLGFSLCLLGVLIGEMFASQRGLGFLAMNAMGRGDIATVLAVALFISVVAIGANALLLRLGRAKHS
ncbi:MAG TPA: ABC transporter permease subunit [Stellaceae bacterium]|nr:ABC transporter permease subunit [Stellaceae bacterium]